MDRIPDLLLSALRVFAAMSPWLVAGFFAAGVLAVWIPRAWVNRALGGRTGLSGVLRAVLVGVPLPICSCGVLPIAAGLRRNGAGKGATAAFLISTPQTGVDSILATYALMGPVFAVARPLAAVEVFRMVSKADSEFSVTSFPGVFSLELKDRQNKRMVFMLIFFRHNLKPPQE